MIGLQNFLVYGRVGVPALHLLITFSLVSASIAGDAKLTKGKEKGGKGSKDKKAAVQETEVRH